MNSPDLTKLIIGIIAGIALFAIAFYLLISMREITPKGTPPEFSVPVLADDGENDYMIVKIKDGTGPLTFIRASSRILWILIGDKNVTKTDIYDGNNQLSCKHC